MVMAGNHIQAEGRGRWSAKCSVEPGGNRTSKALGESWNSVHSSIGMVARLGMRRIDTPNMTRVLAVVVQKMATH